MEALVLHLIEATDSKIQIEDWEDQSHLDLQCWQKQGPFGPAQLISFLNGKSLINNREFLHLMSTKTVFGIYCSLA